jgi:predicted permease
MNALFFSLNSVLPIILLSAFGFYLRTKNVFSQEFFLEGNKFCFKYAFMALMFVNVYSMKTIDDIPWHLVGVAVAGVVLLFCIGIPTVLIFVPEEKQRGVVHQSFYRSNFAVIGLAFASNMFGDEGMRNAALMSALTVPLYNILAVISLSMFIGQKAEKKVHPGKQLLLVLKNIVKNPLIIGVLAGFICVLIRPLLGGWTIATGQFSFIYKSIYTFSQLAMPMALVMLGGLFNISNLKDQVSLISWATAVRLVLAPVLGMCIAFVAPHIFGFQPFTPPQLGALLALYGAPQAVASVAMAEEMGNDGELAAQLLVWSTLFCALTMFVYIAVLRGFGIF